MKIWQRWRERRLGVSDAQALADERYALAQDYRVTFGSPMGQRVLADILRRAGVMQTTYDAHPQNAAFAEGKRRLGLEIIELIAADPSEQQALALSGDTESLFPMPRED